MILTATTDSVCLHKGWCGAYDDLAGLQYQMIGEVNHELSSAYGVLDNEKSIVYRGVYLIDPAGMLRWAAVRDLSVGRNVDEVARVLDAPHTEKSLPTQLVKKPRHAERVQYQISDVSNEAGTAALRVPALFNRPIEMPKITKR